MGISVGHSARQFLVAGLIASLALSGSTSIAFPALAAYTTSTVGTQTTLTFDYTGSLETFTIPANVTEVTVTVTGAEGGRGGADYGIRPPEQGYKGVVSGTIPVTPGHIITVAVGQRGADSSRTGGSSGPSSVEPDQYVAVGGSNPLAGYRGGNGGAPGPDGSSGYGGSGGAASVLKIGTVSAPDLAAVVVAGGSGGSGGNGQYEALQGGLPQATFQASSTVSTSGENGINAWQSCIAVTMSRCDGGGGAAGGGGAQGGKRGEVPFGSGPNTEWYGLGAYPGQNSTSGFSTLTESYNFYTYSGVQNKRSGSVVISYTSGVPSSPTNVNGTPSNSGVDLYWTTPLTAGATAISAYRVEYSVSPFSTWTTAAMCTGTATTCSVTNLTNGTGYKFRVGAENSIGWGSYSALSQELTPSGPPAAPTSLALTPGDGSLSVDFTAGASVAAISDYEYSLNNGTTWFSAATAVSPVSISGLTNGTSYSVVLRALNAAGAGVTSAPASATPSALPGAPTITQVVGGSNGTSLDVTFVAGYSGGSTITGYDYALSDGANTSAFGSYVSAGTTSPFFISGLISGASYTVKLRAKNSAGDGPGSAFQTGVTLAAPSAPIISSVASNDGRLAITYETFSSANDGGSAISRVDYSTDGGVTWIDAGTLATTFTVLGLTNGTPYAVKLRAINAIGTSSASVAVTATPASAPDAPRQVSVSAGQTSAVISWAAPLSNGGLAISGYTAKAYTASIGGSSVATCTTSSLTCNITGLANGTTYYMAVVATNAAGSSVETSPRILVIPAAAPGAPTLNSISAGNAYLSVAFTAGSVDSNAPITGYEYSTNGGTNWVSAAGTVSPLLISPLTNGTTYSVKIRALSIIGYGAASAAVSGTPFTKPSNVDPGSISYTAGNSSVVVSWTAPANNGSAITSSSVTAFSAIAAGTQSSTCNTSGTTTSCTLNGLSNGTTYYVSIETVNGAGYSERSTPRVPVMPGNASSVTLASSITSLIVGESITLTATVTAGAAGTVAFSNGGTALTGCGSVSIVSNIATCTTTSLGAGSNSIRASYSGSSSYASSVSSIAAISVVDRFTITFDNLGGTNLTTSATYVPGSTQITLPSPTKTSYEFDGWFDSATAGTRVGLAGDSYAPTSTRTLYARWVQKSLWGMGASTKIGTITTVSGVANTFSASGGSTSVALSYLADALPAATVLDVYLLADTNRAAQLITDTNSFVVSLVVAWLAADGTVPTTATGKPLGITITNPAIKRGQKIYALLGNSVTPLGTAAQDGSATFEITDDPEIVIANARPDAPSSVAAIAGDARAVISWSAPASNGGAQITGYTATASSGQTCTTVLLTCTIAGLANGTSYTFTVTAANTVGNSTSSSATSSLSPEAPVAQAAPSAPLVPVEPGATYVPVLKTPPTVSQGAIVLVDGKQTEVVITKQEDVSAIRLAGVNWSLQIKALNADGSAAPVNNLALSLVDGSRTSFSGNGFMPLTEVNVYLFSTPKFLGKVTTDAKGSYVGNLPVPVGMAAGLHTLQLSGFLPDGSFITQSIAVVFEKRVSVMNVRSFFTPGSALLKASQKTALAKAAASLSSKKLITIDVLGFVQKTSYSANDARLAKARANAVVAYLKTLKLKVAARGTSQKVATESAAAARRTVARFSFTD